MTLALHSDTLIIFYADSSSLMFDRDPAFGLRNGEQMGSSRGRTRDEWVLRMFKSLRSHDIKRHGDGFGSADGLLRYGPLCCICSVACEFYLPLEAVGGVGASILAKAPCMANGV